MAPIAGPALGVSPAAVGYYIAVAYLGSMLGSAAAGGWVARFGPIRVSQAGLLLCFAGLTLAASGWSPLVLAGAFVVGLGYGPTTPASSVMLVRAAPPALFSLTFSIKQTGVPAGGVLAGAIVPALILAVGCAALYPFPDERAAELACLVVHPEFRNAGAGERLLTEIEARARRAKLKRLFVLTTRAEHWFVERGFDEVSMRELPREKRQLYNYQRRSVVLVKRI